MSRVQSVVTRLYSPLFKKKDRKTSLSNLNLNRSQDFHKNMIKAIANEKSCVGSKSLGYQLF